MGGRKRTGERVHDKHTRARKERKAETLVSIAWREADKAETPPPPPVFSVSCFFFNLGLSLFSPPYLPLREKKTGDDDDDDSISYDDGSTGDDSSSIGDDGQVEDDDPGPGGEEEGAWCKAMAGIPYPLQGDLTVRMKEPACGHFKIYPGIFLRRYLSPPL